ncbi:MAG: hypothetical protein V4655_08470 [Bdellovibrionota bacterium]
MRKKVYSAVLAGAVALAGIYHLFLRQELLSASLIKLRAQSFEAESEHRYRDLASLARNRARLYNEWINDTHLYKGLVVGKDLSTGRATSVCDSLLFSSLRYASLKKLGSDEEADKAWQAIAKNNYADGRWVRHPDCKRKSSSRDMIVGLMAALSQEPKGHDEAFAKLMGIIARTGGSVDDGPFYVSRLSPGLGELLKQMALVRGYPKESLPSALKVGFSTVEFDTWIAEPGFRAHLNAMTLWIELELISRHPDLEFRSLSAILDEISPDLGFGFQTQRRAFAAGELYNLDPENLFFEYLRLRTAGALTFATRARLLEKLLAMPAFPRDRLPQDCDRRADYLWQRGSREYAGRTTCHEQFAGIDFLWMTALLTEEPERKFAYRAAH